ncbi:MAG: hypothetical protein FJW30_08145 [Acidobacteria bacterium]|nr:hypothetical protein [Acidobacteriota bacterium]
MSQPIPIVHVPELPALPPAEPPAAGGSPRAYVNARNNGRSGCLFTGGTLSGQCGLPGSLQPLWVLARGAEALAAGRSQWLLASGETPLAGGICSGLDAELGGLTLVTEPDSHLAVRYGSSVAGTVLLGGGPGYARTFLHSTGPGIVAASAFQRMDVLAKTVPSLARLETLRVEDPPRCEYGRLTNVTPLAALEFADPRLEVAVHNEFVVAAYRGAIDIMDFGLLVRRRLLGEFHPLGMSVDETGRMYLVVDTPEGRRLWVVTIGGQCVETEIDANAFARPPMVDSRHRAVIHSPAGLACYQPGAGQVWRHAGGGRVAGAVQMRDDSVLAATGEGLIRIDAGGRAELVVRSDWGAPVTAPALASDGVAVFATRDALCWVRGSG